MTARLLGFDPDSGLATWWHEDGSGNWAQETAQYTDALLDLNKEAQNHCNPWNEARDVRMVARIPHIIIAKWRNELGIDYYDRDPAVQRKIDDLLNSSDWRWLRVDSSTL